MLRHKSITLIILLCFGLPLSFLVSFTSGVATIDWTDSFHSLFYRLGFSSQLPDAQTDLILTAIRWPRTLLAALVGASLALCGAAMQGLFRNPLADPALIGVSSGASVGAALAIVLGSTIFMGWEQELSAVFGAFAGYIKAYTVSLFAFIGGLLATVLVYRLGTSINGTSVGTMLLAGIAISAFAAAITNWFTFLADDIELRKITLWEMGSLAGATWQKVIIAASLLGLVLIFVPRYGKALNTFLLGESEARHLGIDVQKTKWQLIAWTALGVSVSVSVAGVIGFVGLVVPHLMRLLIGPDHKYLMPASALCGAILLVLSDSLARELAAPAEIPIGIVTAVLGAPLFIYLLLQQRQRLMF